MSIDDSRDQVCNLVPSRVLSLRGVGRREPWESRYCVSSLRESGFQNTRIFLLEESEEM